MIYCFDIDGTICTNNDGAYRDARPIPHMVAQVNDLYRAGHRIILFTARGSTTEIDWRPLTEKQLVDWQVLYHELRFGKPQADFFIDDKALNPWMGGPRPEINTWRLPRSPNPEALSQTHDNTAKAVCDGGYLDITYSADRAPKSDYPLRLSDYLYERAYRRHGRLLDIGCGCGEYLAGFHRQGLDVCGVDISPRAPDYFPQFPVFSVDFENQSLPFAPGTFDFVFCKSVIEHVKNPIALLRNAREVLKPDGTAIFMTPSWMHTYWGPFYIDHTHVTPFTRPSLEDSLHLAGFGEVRVEEFIQLPPVWKFPSLKLLARLLALLPLPYRPMNPAPWPEGLNKLIRFAKEVMLLAFASGKRLG